MKYFTATELDGLRTQHLTEWFANVKSDPTQARLSVFLSHSHKDRPLVEGLIRYFAKQGITIYVDWNDGAMPRVTDRETAAKLKKRIDTCSVFMVLATPNAIDSKWVPWEVGVADQMKGEERITVIPVADASGRYAGAEYLQLYRRFGKSDYSDSPWLFEAQKDNLSVGLGDYFKTFAKPY